MKTYLKNLIIALLAGVFSVLGLNVSSKELDEVPAKELLKISAYVAEMETEVETPLEIEVWMFDNLLFDLKSFAAAVFMVEAEDEKDMQIEDWMSDDSKWLPSMFPQEEDEALKIEEWMMDDEYWTAK